MAGNEPSTLPTEAPSRKRPRTESDSTDEPKEAFSRDEKFWYEDGNIVIVAQNIGFRVYKGLLGTHSDLFRDMFSLPQPVPDVGDEYPVVHVTDTAAELRSLLAALSPKQFSPCRFLELDDLANCIRLAHKYSIKPLLQDYLEELERYFPDTLDAWEKRVQLMNPALAYAIVAVNLARLTDTLSLLPAALYLCCQLEPNQLLEGYVRSDGTADTLSPDDVERCIGARSKLCSLYVLSLLKSTFVPIMANNECLGPGGRCNTSIHSIITRCIGDSIEAGEGDALLSWDKLIRSYEAKKQPRSQYPLCAFCVKVLLRRERRRRIDLWSELPTLLGLEKGDEDNSDA
ncbi:uncharacterized protein B0H18DRAFT_389171 [Fomitopsis serialis]|uniref:uncharacterized protein n=1 Tax=Fomitopsis serialis TaxID=139415 RepID=UPI002008D0E5|nr:uncharacterized protein B0H18DRAFT_389171 [Neoantrodia serialis]KAH9925148.1 hypothetical protein B0H18DRAFT_389171 [Neoantrodia serialis]